MSQTNRDQNLKTERAGFFCEGNVEVRAIQPEGDGETPVKYVIRGYSALFGVRSREMRTYKGKRFVEEIMQGAFDTANFSDASCRFDHRVFLGVEPTARHGVDARGFWFEYDHDPLDPDHVSTLRKIQRGDAKGCSFMYDEIEEGDQEVTFENGVYVRKIKAYRKVWDYGPVIRPAYRQTTVTAFMRSLDERADADEFEAPGEDGAESRSLDGAYDTNTNPTDAQKEAGNYKKGKVRVAGMEMSIENPKGSVRSGVSPDGTAWENEMKAHYGYILGSKAGDGDNLDVFLTDEAESAEFVFVVDQINPDGSFDELKCLIGPVDMDQAKALYMAHYPVDWTGLAAICCLPMEVFKAWAMDGKPKKSPLVYGKGKLYGAYLDSIRAVLESEIEMRSADKPDEDLIHKRKLQVRATLI